MSRRVVVASALAAAVAAPGLVSAQTPGPAPTPSFKAEKCYGIAKAGQNDCASLSGTHSCAGQTKDDMSPLDWKYVAKGTCKDMKGLTEAEAKAAKAKKG